MNSNAVILQHLDSLISENVLGDKQYSSRYKGFVGELAFIEWLQNRPIKRKTYSGGYFLPLEKGNTSLQIQFTLRFPDQNRLNTYLFIGL